MKNMYKLKNLQKIFKDGEKEKEVLKNIDLEIYNDKDNSNFRKEWLWKNNFA